MEEKMVPDLPWYGWVLIAGVIVLTIIVKLPVYRKLYKEKKKETSNP
jgi:hypothetical protein